MVTEKNFKNWIIILPILGVLFTSIVLTTLYMQKLTFKHEKELKSLTTHKQTIIKNIIKSRVDILVDILDKNFQLDKHHNLKFIIAKNQKILNDTLFNNRDYIFAYDSKGITISHIKKEFLGKNRIDLKRNNRFLIKEIINKKKAKDGFFMEYNATTNPNKKQSRKKISYIKSLKSIDWFIGTGIYFDEYKADILNTKRKLEEELSSGFRLVLSVSAGVTLIGLFLMMFLSNAIFDIIKKYQNRLTTKNLELENKVIKRTEEQNSLLALFDKAETLLYKWSFKKNKFTYVSSSIEKLLGYNKEQILEKEISYLTNIVKDDISKYKKEYKKALISEDGYFEHTPYRIRTKHNELKWIRDYKLIVRDNENNLKYIIGYITDITHLKKQEELAIDSTKMLALKDLIGNIAHQWRQPLSAISTASSGLSIYSDLGVLESKLIKENSDLITSQCQYLSNTINSFNNLSIDVYEKSLFFVRTIIYKNLELINSNLESHNIGVITNISEDLQLFTEEENLMQSTLYIINNAVDVLNAEETIQQKFIFIDAFYEKGNIIIKIKDNGGGISSRNINKIFEPYFTTKHQSLGSGLDLYTTKKLIENMNGKITVKNETYIYNNVTYTGALFTIILPKTPLPSEYVI